jgi:hypothetical protein
MARSSSEWPPANPAIAYSTRIERAMEERRSLTAYELLGTHTAKMRVTTTPIVESIDVVGQVR